MKRGIQLADDELWDVLQQKVGFSCPSAPSFLPLHCAGCNKHLGDEFNLEEGQAYMFFQLGSLTLHDSAGRMPRRSGFSRSLLPPPRSLRCSGARGRCMRMGCNAPISSMAEVLSTQHCWKPIGGNVERAWFVNAVDAALQVGPARLEQLAQGPMAVADLFCPLCGANVGWKFVAAGGAENRSQVGRFGLVLSSLRESSRRRQWESDPLVVALERSTSWPLLEIDDHPAVLGRRGAASSGLRGEIPAFLAPAPAVPAQQAQEPALANPVSNRFRAATVLGSLAHGALLRALRLLGPCSRPRERLRAAASRRVAG